MGLNESLKKLSDFVSSLKLESALDAESFKMATLVLNRGDTNLFLIGADADQFRALVEELYQSVVAKGHLSRRAVEKLAEDLLVEYTQASIAEAKPDLARALREGVSALKRSLSEEPGVWEIHLEIQGLDPVGLPFDIGPVQLFFCDEANVTSLTDRLLHLSSAGKEETQNNPIASRILGDVSRLLNRTVAAVTVRAVDFEAAYELARKKLRTTVDALNFYNSHEWRGSWLFIPGESSPVAGVVLGMSSAHPMIGYRRLGPQRPVPLRDIDSRPGFSKIVELLSRVDRSDLEERLLTAVQWAGRAQVDQRREEAFLLFAISLETLLLGRDTTTEITHKLGVRCAHLGGGPSLEEKKRVVRQISDLYRVRSKIVHSGSFQVTDSEFELMREYAFVSLSMVLHREPFKSMSTIQEFDDWFEAQLLSGGSDRVDPSGRAEQV